jgi:hypothetical protein
MMVPMTEIYQASEKNQTPVETQKASADSNSIITGTQRFVRLQQPLADYPGNPATKHATMETHSKRETTCQKEWRAEPTECAKSLQFMSITI